MDEEKKPDYSYLSLIIKWWREEQDVRKMLAVCMMHGSPHQRNRKKTGAESKLDY